MKILHIAKISLNRDNGVNVVVPKHVAAQSAFADTAFINLNNIFVKGINQLSYKGVKNFPDNIAAPFNRPDLVVFHEVNNIEYIALYGKLLKKGIPYFIVPHGEISAQALKKKWLKKKIAYILFFNRFIRKAAAVQSLSTGEYDATVIAPRKFVSPNGIDLPQAEKQTFSDRGMKLLYIGRLDWVHKGLDRLIDAMGCIQDFARENGITLDIYGPDVSGRRAVLEKFVDKNGVADIVKLNDAVFGDQKRDRIMDHDIFIQTSRFEGQPLSVLESMAYSMPAILTAGTNLMSEVVGADCGYGAGDAAEAIGEAIKKAYGDRSDWVNKGRRARQYVARNYSWQKVAAETVEKYKEKLFSERKNKERSK